MLKALTLYFLFLSILFSQNIAAAQSDNLPNTHYFYVIGEADDKVSKAIRSVPLIGSIFGKNQKGQGIFIKNDENTPYVFFMGFRKNAKKTINGFEFETNEYRFQIDQKKSMLIRSSKLSEQNASTKLGLILISKGVDLSAFVHRSELINYVPQAEADKLRNSLTTLNNENQTQKKEIQALQLQLSAVSKAERNKKNLDSKKPVVDVKKLQTEISLLKSELENAKNTIQALLNSD